MSYAFNQSWDMLSKLDEDRPRKRRIIVPKMKLGKTIDISKPKKIGFTDEYKRLMRNLTNQVTARPYTNDDDEARTRSMSGTLQTARGNNNTQISAGGNVNTNPPQEQSAMDLAMEEIRAAQKQREEQAAMFEQMMGGAFRDATGRVVTGISQEARDMIAMLMAQGIPADQAEDIARQQIGE